ncbi:nucleoside hydrolase [Granulicella sibirica]|uniref:Inosine-uridine preferring nucleoside hydrolase n=1 Tax=Granulicella sibirica TaxID=2479048 RepID=A0A4Q0SUB8_9BACT|nr:nucleoside hydrolase [Granulicella sibirica]RXH54615.1 Inosine-uridine preferring nucleoside hydrolase [Granulicella sibirica]
MSTPRRVLFDTDPSPDDAVAFLAALASPDELDVLGITTVAGNVPLELTTKNALKALELGRRTGVPVYAGASAPLVRKLVTAEHVHGRTGFDGYDLPEPTMRPQAAFAPDAIVDLVMSLPARTVTLCCVAPLTNIALAMAREPRLAEYLEGIVLMGGSMSEAGNITPAAEFNFYVDPEAAARVFGSGAPITMIPLDCTHQALITDARLEMLRKAGTPVGDAFYHLLEFNKRFDRSKYGWAGGPLHDATVTAYLLQPDIFEGRHVHVDIECSSVLTLGASVVDWWGVTDKTPNVTVLRSMDADRYFELIFGRLLRL